MRGALSLLLVAASSAARAAPAAQAPGAQAPEPPVFEGPLENDTLLRGDDAALVRLLEGDRQWRAGAREPAFDAWRDALVRAAPDAALAAPPAGPEADPASDPDGTLARRAEDAAWTVARRLAALAPEDRAAWSARFDPLSLAALERAGADPARLAACEREHPRTRGAARAALRLADLALERGDALGARAWCRRGRTHLDGGDAAALAGAFAQREAACPDPRAEPAALTAGSSRLELVRAWDLATPAARPRGDPPRPGLALDASGRAWVHAGGRLVALRADAAAPDVHGLDALLAPGLALPPAFAGEAGPWDEALACGDDVLVLVEGRAHGARGNVLVALDVAGSAPRRLWSWPAEPEGEALPGAPGLVEFAPGPLVAGDLVVVHARRWPRSGEDPPEVDEARVESWVVAFGLRDGRPRWTRHVADGATVRARRRSRVGEAERHALAAPPPAADGARVLVDTGLGVSALLDLADGRLAWALRTQRPGGQADAPWCCRAADAWLLSPSDAGGVLYRLRPDPDADGAGLFAAPPVPWVGPLAPVRAGPRLLALGARAGRAALVDLDPASGRRAWSVPLAGRSDPGGAAVLATEDRALACADGRLSLVDRAADLRLLDVLDLPGAGRAGPCALLGSGPDVWIATPERAALARVR